MIVRSWRLKVQWTFVEVNIFTFVNALMWSVQRMKCFVTPSAPVLTSLANRNLNLSLYPDPPKNEGLGMHSNDTYTRPVARIFRRDV